MPLFGGVEAGGTKFVCALGTGPDDVRAETRFATTTPAETVARTITFFEEEAAGLRLAAIGIASFGPLDPDRSSPTFGFVTSTPKPGWQHTDLAGPIGRALGVPVGFDTDVNGAALAEHRWGAARGLHTFVYLTVGTGLGGGGLANGKLLHGLLHPEMGHMRVPRLPGEAFPGTCPYHGDCLEGLVAGPALEQRSGRPAEELPPDHPAWEYEVSYLAAGLANIICTLSPQRIVMGGGVMQQAHLFPRLRAKVLALLNGYVQAPAFLTGINDYIVPPQLGARAGVLGALALAEAAMTQEP
ncbi:MAG: ROK family protein [Planctomycetota bacterium]